MRRFSARLIRMSGMLALLAAILSGCAAITQLAVPKADPWPRWEAHDPAATARIDHGDWDKFLAAYVVPDPSGINRVAYARVSPADRQMLDRYIARLEGTAMSRLPRAEQFAYWVNLYNAVTVRTILDHYPVDSILDINISPGLLDFGPWDRRLVTVEGEKLSLNDIEHRILRPLWRDPRIHYVVNCAATGCPNLGLASLRAADLDAQLDAAARDFINHPRGARVDNGKLKVSSIYVWYGVDFGRDDAEIVVHLRRYAAPRLAAALAGITRIDDSDYDWALNRAP
ncbi:MAG: DUF547 domain-containing protein [Rhodospirillales bacterium]|nr:DUF547 domain-containing protein [Rhodospirillales bacterium]